MKKGGGDLSDYQKHNYASDRPCTVNIKDCTWRQEYKGWSTTTRITAYRVETLEPAPRCFFCLIDGRMGGDYFDHPICIKKR